MSKICLNMIVKNESTRIERCLKSVIPHISCAVIYDTGSVDQTPQKIKHILDAANIPHVVVPGQFENFEQARNEGLRTARASTLDFDYLLLLDADMELVVNKLDFASGLTGSAYDMVQKADNLSYQNRRLLHRSAKGEYTGVTHEYLDQPRDALIPESQVFIIDHADGANRSIKNERDTRLLLAGLEKEPDNRRYWFYLAQTYRDSGERDQSIEAYRKRIALGGWDEELWFSQYSIALLLHGVDEAAFLREALIAYNMRPSRIEPLYLLARHYRDRSDSALSVLYAEAGMRVPETTDTLFVDEYMQREGLAEEFSISAFYLPARKAEGFQVCNRLALRKDVTAQTRELARSNLFHYLPTLDKTVPSFMPKRLDKIPVGEGFIQMNPSVTRFHDQLLCNVRTVNYKIDRNGRYEILGKDGTYSDTHPIHTRNILCELNNDLTIKASRELVEIDPLPPKWGYVTGHEDIRLFQWDDGLFAVSCRRDLNSEGYCEQILAEVTTEGITTGERLLVEPRQHEKNWMPVIEHGKLRFIYRLGTFVNTIGVFWYSPSHHLETSNISGGSQIIPFKTGWLGLVHEARLSPSDGLRYYQHRFVFLDHNMIVTGLSLPFVFQDRQIEFVAGLAQHPNGTQLVISYGVKDREAWLATVDIDEVAALVIQ